MEESAEDAEAEDKVSVEQSDSAVGHDGNEEPKTSAENPTEDSVDPTKQDLSEDKKENPGISFRPNCH